MSFLYFANVKPCYLAMKQQHKMQSEDEPNNTNQNNNSTNSKRKILLYNTMKRFNYSREDTIIEFPPLM